MKAPFWMIALGMTALFIITCCLGLVYVANHNTPNVVRKDYYEAGVHLDEQRGREAGFDSLHLKLDIQEIHDTLVLQGAGVALDSAQINRIQSMHVKLVLQRPDDPAADRELVLSSAFSDPSHGHLFWRTSTSPLRKGKWECQVVFADNEKPVMERSFSYFAGG